MTFLALSQVQALAAALVTSLLVVVLFFLRLRRNRVVVGSSILWDRVVELQRSRSLMERLRRILSLLLALVIALLIVLASGRPYVGASDAAPAVAIVIDNSASMASRTFDGRTRLDRAKELALNLVSERTPLEGFMIADTAGRIHTPFIHDMDRVVSVLESLEPFPGPAAFPGLPFPGVEAYLVSDGVAPLEVPDSVVRLSVSQPASNAAITALDVAVDPESSSGYRVAFEIVNFGSEPVEVRALLSGTGEDRLAWIRPMEAGEVWQESLDLSGFRGGPLRLRIEAPGDALELDDSAFAYLPPENQTRLGLVADGVGRYLETLLSLSPGLEVRVVPPGSYGPDPEIDLYVFAGFTPTTPPEAPAIYFGPDERPWLPEVGGRVAEPVPNSWDRDHPVMRDVPLRDLRIAEARRFEPEGWSVLATAEETPLVMAGSLPTRSIVVGFGLEDSDFPFHLAFPIFMGNAIEWLSGEGLARRSGLGIITVPEEAESLTRLDGSAVPFDYSLGHTRFAALAPDLFTMSVDGRRVRIAASLGSRAESAVNATAPIAPRPASEPQGRELWTWMLMIASMLVLMEWWTYHRRLTL